MYLDWTKTRIRCSQHLVFVVNEPYLGDGVSLFFDRDDLKNKAKTA